MYPAHFGLQKRLFDEGIAAETAVFRSPQHDTLIAHFKLALGSATSVVVLRGQAGVGKSTLTSAALRASSTRLALAWLHGTPTNGAELLELLLVELGLNAQRATRVERLQVWRQFQSEMSATESRLFIVVERTEDLAVDVLHALDSLTAADAGGHPGANVVLLGHRGLDTHLAAPVLDSFRQRIRLRAELDSFTQAELQDYLRHRMACAKGHFDQVFAPGAVAALHRFSGGVARLANNLCETALTLAASRQNSALTAELVTEVAVTLLGLTDAAPPLPPSAATAAAATTRVLTLSEATTAAATSRVALTPSVAAVARAAPSSAPPSTPTIATTPSAAPKAPVSPSASALAAEPPRRAPEPMPSAATSASPRRKDHPRPAPPTPSAEFDGGATDVSDVAMVDFPVLTDAVEPAHAPAAPKRAGSVQTTKTPPARVAPPEAAAEPTTPARTVAASAPAATASAVPPLPTPTRRVETAYAPTTAQAKQPSSAARAQPATTAPAKPAAPQPPMTATPRSANPPSDGDVLRQTQTMRALAVAKSIDDVSDSVAETLFNDAELDLLTAAFASSAGWTETSAEAPAGTSGAAAKPVAQPAANLAETPDDDLLGLLGLGDDAPLELLDDAAEQPGDQPRKTAQR